MNNDIDYICIVKKVGTDVKSDEIIRICKEKFRTAKMLDPKFIEHDFKWILGFDIILELHASNQLRKNKNDQYELFGMEVKIDYEYRDEICLFMEVK